ncbi:MAG: tRNA uridine(34) 5-carboxymethylaminomethyl modification radical SAM/GNAT enzyme Elp3 [Desulfurococcaceae archaeon]
MEGRLRKLSRVLSGVAPVAVMTEPYPCPHGKCLYCPGGPDQGTPQSYVGEEPALMRAIRVNYDPYLQTLSRLKQYHEVLGYFPSKVELIVMGGTFPAMPMGYQEWFIAMALEAMNDYPYNKAPKTVDLASAQLRNETANVRCIAMTIETRPDWSREKHVDFMLHLGATRVELGVQSIYDDVLEVVRRGHTVRDVVEATRVAKDSGLKVTYHIMPGLPGSDYDKDLEMIKEIFSNPDYRPDYLKIYPTIVVKGTGLYELWIKGSYTPYTDEEAVELISEMYRHIPEYVRVIRVQRDVPAKYIEAGPKKGNLRELVEEKCLEKGITIREIRWREIGRQIYKLNKVPRESCIKMKKTVYEASGGTEVFLSVEDTCNDALIGFLRLRIPSEKAHRSEVDSSTTIVRELHIYGLMTPIGAKPQSILGIQHKGFGKKLLFEAERLSLEEYDRRKILVLSGIGAREYYRKLGYSRLKESPYMVKFLK